MKVLIADDDRVHMRPEINRRGEKMKVLGEDNDVVTSWLVDTTLRSWEYEVCRATDGVTAANWAGTSPSTNHTSRGSSTNGCCGFPQITRHKSPRHVYQYLSITALTTKNEEYTWTTLAEAPAPLGRPRLGSATPDSPEVGFGALNPVSRAFECVRHFISFDNTSKWRGIGKHYAVRGRKRQSPNALVTAGVETIAATRKGN